LPILGQREIDLKDRLFVIFKQKNFGQFIYDISLSGFLKALKYEKYTKIK